MKKFKDPHNKHLRRYLFLSIIIFLLLGLGHLILVVKSLPIVIDGIPMDTTTSYFIAFMSFMMVIMGCYYHRAVKK